MSKAPGPSTGRDSRDARRQPRRRRDRAQLPGASRNHQPHRRRGEDHYRCDELTGRSLYRAAHMAHSAAPIAAKSRTLSKYQWIAAHTSAYTIQINRFSDRHFWHEGYDKANQGRGYRIAARTGGDGEGRGRDERPQESRGFGAQIATAGSAVTASPVGSGRHPARSRTSERVSADRRLASERGAR